MLEFIGPFGDDNYVFSIDGYKVPYLEGKKVGENEWYITLSRAGAAVFGSKKYTAFELQTELPFIVTCMAVAAGFTSFGGNAREINPFDVKISALG
jgi:hypothetical protein